jgi:hypothetical protein
MISVIVPVQPTLCFSSCSGNSSLAFDQPFQFGLFRVQFWTFVPPNSLWSECVLNSKSVIIRSGPFSFPRYEDINPDLAQELRYLADAPSYRRCGAVLVQGMPCDFCCEPSGDRVPHNLLPPMDEELLNRTIHFTESNGVFRRIWNRDLWPALQNAGVSSPNAITPNSFISGISNSTEYRFSTWYTCWRRFES